MGDCQRDCSASHPQFTEFPSARKERKELLHDPPCFGTRNQAAGTHLQQQIPEIFIPENILQRFPFPAAFREFSGFPDLLFLQIRFLKQDFRNRNRGCPFDEPSGLLCSVFNSGECFRNLPPQFFGLHARALSRRRRFFSFIARYRLTRYRTPKYVIGVITTVSSTAPRKNDARSSPPSENSVSQS